MKCCSTTSPDISVQTDAKNTQTNSNFTSEIEKAILNATNEPIQVNSESELITINGETGLWSNTYRQISSQSRSMSTNNK